MTVRN